jgi:hypothetical protein
VDDLIAFVKAGASKYQHRPAACRIAEPGRVNYLCT